MNTIYPERLVPGDTVGVITPASPPFGVKAEFYQRGLSYLRNRGFNVVEGRHSKQQRGYLAGSDEERAADINEMFANENIKAIFCTRGGYGTLRLLSLIDYNLIRNNPKILVGYSDITSLQLAILANTGLITFSGPMVAVEMGKGIHQFTEASMWRILMSEYPAGELPLPENHEIKIYQPGVVTGPIIGGCASLINPLLNTPYLPSLAGAILLLEDIGEDSYRLDRYWAQLRLAGVLQELGGIILGDFINCEPNPATNDPFLSIEELVQDYFLNLTIPVIGNFPYGHGDIKLTIPIGAQAYLDTDEGKVYINDLVVV